MKRKLIVIPVTLFLLAVLAAPLAAYAADGSTIITGDVVSSYSFSKPPDFILGNMALGATVTSSNSGTLTGNNSNGYTVTAIDTKTSNTGHMVSGSNVLQNKFKIGNSAGTVADSDVARTLLDVTGAQNGTTVPLYVSQQIALTDPVATNYSITITFTVTPK